MTPAILKFSELFRLDDGQPIRLEAWEIEVLRAVFGALDAEGRRVIHEAVVSTGKKSGKTELASLVIAYMLLADEQKPNIVIGLANDREQAGHAFLRVKRSFENSPALGREVRVKQDIIERRDNRGYFKIVSADLPSAGGERPSMLAIDEIGYARGWALINEFLPGPERPEPLVWYTGFRGPSVYNQAGCPLHDLLERKGDPELFIYDYPGNPSSWCTAEFLAARKRQLPDCEYRRVWCNEWAAAGDSFLSPAMIEAAVDADLGRGVERREDAVYLAGLDLGLRHDRSAYATVAVRDDGVVEVVQLLVWEGSRAAEVNISEVESAIKESYYTYFPGQISFDPWQSVGLAQSLTAAGLPMHEFTITQASKNRLARGIYSFFSEGKIRIPDSAEFRRELASLVIVPTPLGIKWDHVKGLHDDMTMATAIALAPIFEEAITPRQFGYISDENFFDLEA